MLVEAFYSLVPTSLRSSLNLVVTQLHFAITGQNIVPIYARALMDYYSTTPNQSHRL